MFVPASPGQVKQARHSCPPTRSSAENTWRSESPARRDVLAFLEGEFPERRAPSPELTRKQLSQNFTQRGSRELKSEKALSVNIVEVFLV